MYLPGMSGGIGNSATAGMSDQEAAMVKAVSRSCMIYMIYTAKKRLTLSMVDARSYGKLSFQDRDLGGDGLCSWRGFRSVHVKRA